MAPQAVRTVLAGYGYWGVNLARNLAQASTTELVGVVDPDEHKRSRAEADHPGLQTFVSLDDALRDEQVEAVVLATPASLHEQMALQVIEAGRHVLVEKPLADSAAGADRIVAAGESAEVVVMVGHTFLYSPPVKALRELVRNGELGRVQYLYSQRLSLGRIRKDCNALWNFAPHDVSIMMYLLDARPVEVSARGFRFIGDVDDVCFASLEFEGGIGANIHVSWIDPRKTRLMTVVGDQQMAIYNDVSVDQKLWIVDAGVAESDDFGSYESLGDFQWRTRAGDIRIPRIAMSEPLRNELTAFGEACRSGQQPPTHGIHGAGVVRVLEAIDRSAAAHGAPIEIDW